MIIDAKNSKYDHNLRKLTLSPFKGQRRPNCERSFYKDKSYTQWAKELKCSTESISKHIEKYGHLDNVGKLTSRTNPQLYKGKPFSYWAKIYDRKPDVIRGHFKRFGNLNGMKNARRKNNQSYEGKPISYWAKLLDAPRQTICGHLNKYGNLNRMKKYKAYMEAKNKQKLDK